MKDRILACMFALLAGLISLNAQSVTGNVSSAEGVLPGVSIVEKGTTNGTIMDENGKYSLNVPTTATLVFSFLGFETVEVAVNGQASIDVNLQSSITELGQVVVTAYGTSKKSSFTGAFSVAKSEDIQKIAAPTITARLQGNVSGVQVQTTNGSPGEPPQILRIKILRNKLIDLLPDIWFPHLPTIMIKFYSRDVSKFRSGIVYDFI